MANARSQSTLAPTGWALLGMLSSGEEMSGYDIKKWTNWVLRFFYQSPAYSQIYSELKKMEELGFVTSRVDNDGGARSRRLYRITPEGQAAIEGWTREESYDPPVLKHSALLRVTLGHLTDPDRLRSLLQDHVAFCDRMQREAGLEARFTEDQPAWAYARVALRWAERYYASEREQALNLIKDLDEADAEFAAFTAGSTIPWPDRQTWYEVEQRVKSENAD